MHGTWIAVVAGLIALTLALNGWILARTRMNPDHGARLAFLSALTSLLALPICLASFGVYAVGLFQDLPNPSGITFLASAAVVMLSTITAAVKSRRNSHS
ncbi:hypothetical protein [Xanthomonas bonasiae]|uniref:hypothetical protein n=1 Tax=Xanthomonas bonasiae TaxID=2810351 RepID=UPI00177AEC3C|nr:hypothetical protein [Xanthomonas surreyensis]MBD7923518.1 hypothetical protein [Xanthomonas surreyensis]